METGAEEKNERNTRRGRWKGRRGKKNTVKRYQERWGDKQLRWRLTWHAASDLLTGCFRSAARSETCSTLLRHVGPYSHQHNAIQTCWVAARSWRKIPRVVFKLRFAGVKDNEPHNRYAHHSHKRRFELYYIWQTQSRFFAPPPCLHISHIKFDQ